jgi:uncharacterized 2Fe-2S/4Fe-4S cluster protein (DUF4445 family)
LSKDPLVVFLPSGKRGQFPVGTPILDCARKLGVDIDSVCGGRGICGRCQVNIGDGEFSKFGINSRPDSLTPISASEEKYDERRGLIDGRRLSCHAQLNGDVVIDVPPESQVHKQVVRKRAEVRAIEMDPAIRLHYVEVEEPDMHKPEGDLERLHIALAEQWDIHDLEEIDIRSLQKLQKALRDGDWKVTVAVHREQRITAIWPGFQDRAFGLAFDIGTTTVAVHLSDLASGDVIASDGIMNPQIRFGEDLMSRVSYIMMNPGSEADITNSIRDGINDLIKRVRIEAGVKKEEILNATFVGNPVMHHLLLGIDPTELGGAPFALATNTGMTLWASELDIRETSPDARVYILPCIAGHVGADTAGVLLSEEPHLSDEMTLIVDVGTNAEIILGNKHRLLAASSPTGPAFEGAQIACGQRAAPGAIERVRIDPETLDPRFKVIGCDLWSDDPAFADAIAAIGITGICGSGIIEVLAEMYLCGLITTDGVINGAMGERSYRIQATDRTFRYLLHMGDMEIAIYQNDVRAIQLAKAALYAGARLLMDKMEIESVDKIVLAGAFGSHIDTKYAMVLGMIPDCDLDKVYAAGNAAGTGARIALLNQQARDDIQTLVKKIEKVETAVEAKFQDHFVEAMAIPHKTASSPNLSKVVVLPAPVELPVMEADNGRRGRKGRRRRS